MPVSHLPYHLRAVAVSDNKTGLMVQQLRCGHKKLQKSLLISKAVVTSSWRGRYLVVTSRLEGSLPFAKKSLPKTKSNDQVTTKVTTNSRSWPYLVYVKVTTVTTTFFTPYARARARAIVRLLGCKSLHVSSKPYVSSKACLFLFRQDSETNETR